MNCDYTDPSGAPLERLAKQQSGTHPAPCARSCEANAYEIQIRRLSAERDALAAKLKDAEHDRDEFRRVMNGFAEKMAELEGQKPVAWMEWAENSEAYFLAYSENPEATNKPLYARPVPAELSPDFTDTARAALLWVLWHHQGGSSPVGQPIRYALGMDAHERLSEHQVQEAKRWAALTKSESTDFRQARTAPAEPVNVDFGKRGENMFFKIDNQSFLLEYKPEEQDEFDFMKAMLLSAFSRITHGVKTEIQPVNARLLTALKASRHQFAHYVAHHIGKGDMHKAMANEAMVAMADVAIMAAEAAPKAARLTEEEIKAATKANALNGLVLRICRAIEAAVLRKNGTEVAE